jgi:hypothetical protein
LKQTETAKLLAVVKTAYPNFDITEPVIRLWHQMLLNITFEAAQKNLFHHIQTNRFPPTISDILRKDPDQFTDHDALRAETQRYLERRQEALSLEGWTVDDDDV